jgi:hypothetical protein
MKSGRKAVAALGLLLAVLGSLWWLPAPQGQQVPRVTLVGITNSVAGKRVANFSITNASDKPVLFAPVLEVRTEDGTYERWAAGPPEMPATALLANVASTFATTVPDTGTPWRLRVLWQPKPTKADYAYASTLDRLLRVFRRADYPKRWVPVAHTWHDLAITPESPPKHDAEPAPPDGSPAKLPRNPGAGGGAPSAS